MINGNKLKDEYSYIYEEIERKNKFDIIDFNFLLIKNKKWKTF